MMTQYDRLGHLDIERRQLTVMFCDIAGSSALAARMDPEDFGAMLVAYRRVVAATVARFGGMVARYVGDGVLACWGYPRARPGDAASALSAALAIRAAFPPTERRGFALRIAVDAGAVLVGAFGADATQAADIVGAAPNVAAELQALGAPGDVMTTATLRDMVGEGFVFEPTGERRLKACLEPQRLYRLLAVADSHAPPRGRAATRRLSTAPAPRRLDAAAAARFVADLDPAARLSPRARRRIVELADGAPLDLRDLARLDVERSAADDAALFLDASAIAERWTAQLDDLGPLRIVAQIAAALGDAAEATIVARLAGMAMADLRVALAGAPARDLLRIDAAGRVVVTSRLLAAAARATTLRARRRAWLEDAGRRNARVMREPVAGAA